LASLLWATRRCRSARGTYFGPLPPALREQYLRRRNHHGRVVRPELVSQDQPGLGTDFEQDVALRLGIQASPVAGVLADQPAAGVRVTADLFADQFPAAAGRPQFGHPHQPGTKFI
jgi:hypothetical protein